ncbi:hypothetical protein GOBAR_AA37411 [Gossypium barbadense]|uniref:Uncharacterized protein n=1 Tax=Gossypium barbadense TaxID=3634 RepID=A0A2P5VWS8_GOSBA|nr:hypothetical protein GOBAR_DD06596 [Gossypium barbadense]PPR83302.1 hypothetical protein GOBAR_AA37411 [Gossypium barbadense]
MPLKKQPSKKLGLLGSISNAQSFGKIKDEEVEDLEWGLEQVSINEVPRNMRQVSQKAYTPQLISIGPLHYRKRNLASISKYKVNYQEKFLQKTSKKTLESFRSFIELKEKVILNSYEALIYEDEFVMMIFYDALFIMELFLRKYKKEMKNDSKITDFLLKEMWSTVLEGT